MLIVVPKKALKVCVFYGRDYKRNREETLEKTHVKRYRSFENSAVLRGDAVNSAHLLPGNQEGGGGRTEDLV